MCRDGGPNLNVTPRAGGGSSLTRAQGKVQARGEKNGCGLMVKNGD